MDSPAGSLKDYLVKPGQATKALSEITRKKGSSIDMLRCILLTALDIAEALKFMHRVNTLHGDLKPHNILLVHDKHVRLSTSSVTCLFSGLSVQQTVTWAMGLFSCACVLSYTSYHASVCACRKLSFMVIHTYI